jgi:uncharacterized membrane protein
METMRSIGSWMSALHVLAALWFAAGVFSSSVVLAQVKRAKSPAERAFGVRLVARLMNVFIVPGVLAAGVLGFYLVTGLHYGFGSFWVKASIAVYLLVLAGILFYQAPHVRKSAETGDAIAKGPAMLTHVVALAIVVMVVLMALKPTP